MTFDEIETAVGQRLEGMDGVPDIAWPNRAFTPDGTYVEFRHAPIEQVDETVSGGFTYQTGLFLITVVTEAGNFTRSANVLAQSIADLFPKATRIATDGGDVLITAPASFGTGFQDGTYWRQPIRISYITEPNYGPAVVVGTGALDFSDPENSGLLILFEEP